MKHAANKCDHRRAQATKLNIRSGFWLHPKLHTIKYVKKTVCEKSNIHSIHKTVAENFVDDLLLLVLMHI